MTLDEYIERAPYNLLREIGHVATVRERADDGFTIASVRLSKGDEGKVLTLFDDEQWRVVDLVRDILDEREERLTEAARHMTDDDRAQARRIEGILPQVARAAIEAALKD